MPGVFRRFKNYTQEYPRSSVGGGIVSGIVGRDCAGSDVDDLIMPDANLLPSDIDRNEGSPASGRRRI